jgi:hypothetical protein
MALCRGLTAKMLVVDLGFCQMVCVGVGQQLITGLRGTIVRGHQHMQNSMVNTKTMIYIGSVRWKSVLHPVWGE